MLHRADATELEPSGTWDPLGHARHVLARLRRHAPRSAAEQALPAPFSAIAPETMVPVSHILWSHVWLGIATDAFDRARAFVRAAARRAPGEPVPAAVKLSHVDDAAVDAARPRSTARWTSTSPRTTTASGWATMAFALHFNNLKLAASEQVPRVCQGAMGVCGIVGFKNDTPFSVGRHLRDAMSACADGRQRPASTRPTPACC